MNKFDCVRDGEVQFEQVWGSLYSEVPSSGGGGGELYGEVQCFMGNCHMRPLPRMDRQTGLKITFPQLRWRMVIITSRNEVVAKVIFLHLFVILFTGGSASVYAGIPTPPGAAPPGADTPRSRHLPGPDTPPPSSHPLEQTPPRPDATPPGPDTLPGADPPRSRHPGVWSMSGRYASYWNAFLYSLMN